MEPAAGEVRLAGYLTVPEDAAGIVVFAHGSGSRHSPRNRHVARVLNKAGLGTLLFDLLTPEEEPDRANVFDISLLARRLTQVTGWLRTQPRAARAAVGYFGASTGAAAALWAAAEPGAGIAAVVSRGGRPDLARPRLAAVTAPARGDSRRPVQDFAPSALHLRHVIVPMLAQPGAAFALFADLIGGTRLGADRAGAPHRPAERIGARMARQLLAEVDSGATIDRHASDQIIPFASPADGTSSFQVPSITEHTETAAWLAWLFLRAEVRATGNTLVVHGRGACSLRMDSHGEDDPPTRAPSRLR